MKGRLFKEQTDEERILIDLSRIVVIQQDFFKDSVRVDFLNEGMLYIDNEMGAKLIEAWTKFLEQ
ncbi:hypothetical protein [Synechocystis sp. CACIAM 05]|uniref:hypothetical protein n=1 Tax=Synechocystis sp. CACIAM 05 TaxID=1933929 RepID=UPI00138E6919|nr:hypothetical protein [Synechocystis sp. CACIAM 05]QHU99992.1 hypothetical protein BWK47_07550 [Synechocystis sp. CACIAM 05]